MNRFLEMVSVGSLGIIHERFMQKTLELIYEMANDCESKGLADENIQNEIKAYASKWNLSIMDSAGYLCRQADNGADKNAIISNASILYRDAEAKTKK